MDDSVERSKSQSTKLKKKNGKEESHIFIKDRSPKIKNLVI